MSASQDRRLKPANHVFAFYIMTLQKNFAFHYTQNVRIEKSFLQFLFSYLLLTIRILNLSAIRKHYTYPFKNITVRNKPNKNIPHTAILLTTRHPFSIVKCFSTCARRNPTNIETTNNAISKTKLSCSNIR